MLYDLLLSLPYPSHTNIVRNIKTAIASEEQELRNSTLYEQGVNSFVIYSLGIKTFSNSSV
jgi:hypothetical protein